MKNQHLTIISLAALVIVILVYAFLLIQNQSTRHQAFPSEINRVKLDCSKPIGEQMVQIDKSVDVKKAISLAYTSQEFVSKANQYGNVTYNSFFNDFLTGDPCNTMWKGTEIVFSTTAKNGLARNIQVSEDINLTRVLNVTDYQSGFSK